jgi:NDP-sugar pyrophosphorylase family protein
MDTAVVIAGGKGLRLMPLTQSVPKSLVEVGGKPLLYWIIRWLKSYRVKHLVIGVAYKKEKIFEFMKGNDNFGLEVEYSEDLQGGTAQAFRLAIKDHVSDEDFFAMNGDELTNMDLGRMESSHLQNRPIVTMALTPFKCLLSTVKIEKGKVADFEYGKILEDVPVSIGIYAFNRHILDYLPDTGSVEDLTFKKLAPQGKILAHMLQGKEEWITVNTQKDITEAEAALRRWGALDHSK